MGVPGEKQTIIRSSGLFIAIGALVVLVSCTMSPALTQTGRRSVTLDVFAAASLAEAFGELGQQFEAEHPGMQVVFNFAGSQQLAHQLAQGAPADVFASADQNQILSAVQAGRVAAEGAQVFASNRMVVITPTDNPGQIGQLLDLARPGLRIVLAAREAPVGRYSQALMERAGADPAFGPDFQERVSANIVSYEENVRAVVSKVTLGEADAGIVYASDAGTGGNEQVRPIEIPASLQVLADYWIASLLDSSEPELAGQFVAYVLSEKGQKVLFDHGFIPPD